MRAAVIGIGSNSVRMLVYIIKIIVQITSY